MNADITYDGKDYIDREVVRETEKAYLVKLEYSNRRDGTGTKFRWVGKSICKPMSPKRKAVIDNALANLPDEYKKFVHTNFVAVPEWIGGQGIW